MMDSATYREYRARTLGLSPGSSEIEARIHKGLLVVGRTTELNPCWTHLDMPGAGSEPISMLTSPGRIWITSQSFPWGHGMDLSAVPRETHALQYKQCTVRRLPNGRCAIRVGGLQLAVQDDAAAPLASLQDRRRTAVCCARPPVPDEVHR
jgi:hypothetical protein